MTDKQYETEQIRDLEKLVHRNRELIENGRSKILQIDQRIRCDDRANAASSAIQDRPFLQ